MVARKLLLSHVALALKQARASEDTAEPPKDEPKKLPRGQMQLYSFYRPGLQAEDYVIEVEQQITAPQTESGTQSLKLTNVRVDENQNVSSTPQRFTVVVPRFTLDRSIINSYYPPDGHKDEGRILPHIVFNDPHFPWEIPAGSTISPGATKTRLKGMIDEHQVPDETNPTQLKTIYRNMVPWIALLVFDVDELRFTSEELPKMKEYKLQGFNEVADLNKQNANGTFTMTVADYYRNVPDDSRNDYKREANLDMLGNTDNINVIFPRKDLIRKAIGQHTDGSSKSGLEYQKYLAHVRHINTQDCPDAIVQQQGIFSVLMCPRTGSVFDDTRTRAPMTKPKTQVCHLITIEHLDATIDRWSTDPTGRVGLISLFSWIYTALPPDPVNFVTTMRHLTENQQMLRVDNAKLEQLDESVRAQAGQGNVKAQVGRIMASRLRAGYTISRWRTQTGEETVAFNRGPLVPMPQPTNRPPALDLPDCSNTSQAYQILDPLTGMMDLTYSSAWQAGKILAISDTNFSAALMRFRSRVYTAISSRTRMVVNGLRDTRDLVASIADAVPVLNLASDEPSMKPSRFRPCDTGRCVTLLKDSDAAPALQSNTASIVEFNAMAGDEIFNDFNTVGPNNSDWAIVHSWLADKLLLGGIPSQYLLPESSYLPKESLRFFYIDDWWLDCLIDGALSVANHLDGDDDLVRREMKKMFNTYLRTSLGDPKLVPRNPILNPQKETLKPQIPCYGFVMRSQLVKVMPDMKIEVTWKQPDARLEVCRWTKWDDQTLLALVDRPPEELESIILKQPAHQQRFSLGTGLDVTDPNNVQIPFIPMRLYTERPPARWGDLEQLELNLTSRWYDVSSRVLKLELMARELNQKLAHPEDSPTGPGKYDDPIPNSCEFGLELNDPCYYFMIKPPQNSTPPFTERDRQLWVKDPPPVRPPPIEPPPPPPSQPPPPTTTPTPPPPSTPPVSIPTAPDRQPRIQPLPQSIAQRNARATTTTVQSRFDLRIFPDYKGPPKRYPQDKYDPADFLPTQNIYFYDLIFSIRKKPNFQHSLFDLLKIVIDLPVATPDSNSRTEALLTPNYDGPGLRMLSNQRFIPFLYHDVPSAPMHVELIPRSADDDYALRINDRKSTEMGFRLAEANVSPVRVSSDVEIVGERFRQPRGKVVVTMTEYYRTGTPDGVDAVSSQYRLIKWDRTDDVELDDGLLP